MVVLSARAAGAAGSETLADVGGEGHEGVGVAPLVVVPGDDLHQVARHLGQLRVEDALVRVGDDVGGHDLVLDVRQDALERALGGSLDRGVDLLDRDLLGGGEGEVGRRAGDGRDAQGVAVQLALELRQHERDGLGGAGRGRDDVLRGGAGAAEVLVRAVLQVLVTRVGVDRGHEATLDADRVVERLRQRGEAVRGARRVGDDVVRGRVVLVRVHADDERRVLVLRRGGDDDLLRAAVDVGLGLRRVGEEAGRLDDDVGAQLAPGEVRGVALGERTDLLAVDDDVLVVEVHAQRETAEDRVVLEQVRERLVVREVVDAHDLDVSARRHDGAVEVPSDTTEAVDTDADGHNALLRARRVYRRTRLMPNDHVRRRTQVVITPVLAARTSAQHPSCSRTATATAGTTHAHEGCQRRSTSLSPDVPEPLPTPLHRVTWIPRFGTMVPKGRDVHGATCRGARNTARCPRCQRSRSSGLRPASVSGIPSSAARLSAVDRSRRIRPATASFVSGGTASWPSSSSEACLCARRSSPASRRWSGRSGPRISNARSTRAPAATAARADRRRFASSKLASRFAVPRTSRRVRRSSHTTTASCAPRRVSSALIASPSRMTTRSTPRTSRDFAEIPSRRAAPTSASAASGPGHVTSSAEDRPGSVSEPWARNAPRQAASASSTPPDTTCGGRPRTGRPRWSSRPVWRASDSPSRTTRTTYRLPLRSPPADTTISSLVCPYTSAIVSRRRRAATAVSSSASMTIRPEMRCRPPEKRSVAATSALRQDVLSTRSRASSSFTCAVSAMAPSCHRSSGRVGRRPPARAPGARAPAPASPGPTPLSRRASRRRRGSRRTRPGRPRRAA